MENIGYDDNYVKGTVHADEDGLLYTSIIYDRGWTVLVDGEETEYTSIGDALIAIPLEAGDHTIELNYYPEGKKAGRFITIASITLLIGIMLVERHRDKKIKNAVHEEEIVDEIQEKEES